MISETAVLVEGDDEEGFVPLRGFAEGLVDSSHEVLAHVDRGGGVHRHVVAAFWVDPAELRQGAGLRVGVELVNGLDVLGGVLGDPVVEHGIRRETAGSDVGGVFVVDPRDALFGQLLEDGVLLHAGGVIDFAIVAIACRCSRSEIGTVAVSRARNGREPTIEEDKVLCHGVGDRDEVGRVVVHHFGCARHVVFQTVSPGLLGDEALH